MEKKLQLSVDLHASLLLLLTSPAGLGVGSSEPILQTSHSIRKEFKRKKPLSGPLPHASRALWSAEADVEDIRTGAIRAVQVEMTALYSSWFMFPSNSINLRNEEQQMEAIFP